MRRVVVTGLGMVSPLACGVEPSWSRLLAGQSGARRIEGFDVSDLACKIAMPVPRGGGGNGSFNPDQWMEPKEQRKIDDFILYAVAAAAQALADAGWKPATYEEQIKTGVLIGSGVGGPRGGPRAPPRLEEKGPPPVFAFLHPRPADQSLWRLCLNSAWPQGAEPFGRYRVLDRNPCDRRRRAHDRPGRCRRHGRWGDRIGDQ